MKENISDNGVLDIRIWLNPPILKICFFIQSFIIKPIDNKSNGDFRRNYFEFQEIDVYSFLAGPGGRWYYPNGVDEEAYHKFDEREFNFKDNNVIKYESLMFMNKHIDYGQ
ncbi:hypothetical protein RCL_jg19049.t1 [Rhizophagus clarus]|uniref:Uncharacterized protein n=1 Tax=Rhizophagus clarus TaxID=94130 RepID=A0A8H3QW78_9GLOM|nr:hypothetical protein RCL_jg19049.t1 [Rhizophagus clarus]